MSLKKGNKVRINYEELVKGYEITIKQSLKDNPFTSESLTRSIVSDEIKKMKDFDEEYGDVRTIISISYKNLYGKNKINRYTLNNDFVYYGKELEKA